MRRAIQRSLAPLLIVALAGCTPTGGGGDEADARPADDAEADGAPTDAGPGSDGQAADGQPADGQPADGQPADGQPADGEPAPDACVDCGAAPRVLTFDANVRALTEGGEIRLSAVVTDPDGGADLLGGVLEDPSGAPFGPFEAAGDVGTYGFTLTWAALHAIDPITFDGEATREIVAAFFDQAGNRTEARLELTLHCRDNGGAACDGVCVSLDSQAHCGACDAACETECVDRACACPGEDQIRCDDGRCVDTQNDPENCGGCDRACPGIADGEGACVRGRCQIQCAPDHQLCDPDDLVCAPCPVDGVIRTGCDGRRCVADTCADGFRVCDGLCAACPPQAERTLCLGDRCVAAECARGTHPCSEGCCPWRPLLVGQSPNDFAMVAAEGAMHFAIGEPERVFARRWVEGRWNDVVVAEFERAGRSSTRVALAASNGVVHLAYAVNSAPVDGQFLLGHHRYADGRWAEAHTLADEGLVFDPLLAARDDAVWLIWDQQGQQLVDPRDVPWRPELVLDGDEADVALGADGTLHVVGERQIGSGLLYAQRGPDGVLSDIDPDNGRLGEAQPDVALDGDGLPAILHREDFNGDLYLTRFDGRAWDTRQILRGYQTEEGLDMIRGVDGGLIICAGTQLGLFVFFEDGQDWRPDEVADGFHAKCQLALAPDGGLHVISIGGGGITWYR